MKKARQLSFDKKKIYQNLMPKFSTKLYAKIARLHFGTIFSIKQN